MQFHSTSLDVNGTDDEIDQDIGLRPSRQLELFLQDPGRFAHRPGVMKVQIGECVRIRSPGGRRGETEEEKENAASHGVSAPTRRAQKMMMGVPTRASW